jgi:hypothetical protein
MPSLIVRVDALRTVAAASISGTYTPLGSGFAHQMRLIKITNNTNADLTFSFDMVTDNLFVPQGSFTLFDLSSNKGSPDTIFCFQNGTQIYVKGTPSTGSVYLECIYGRGE